MIQNPILSKVSQDLYSYISGISGLANIIVENLSSLKKTIYKSLLNKPINSHGIGITIFKQLIELLDGEIHIESQKGEGAKL